MDMLDKDLSRFSLALAPEKSPCFFKRSRLLRFQSREAFSATIAARDSAILVQYPG